MAKKEEKKTEQKQEQITKEQAQQIITELLLTRVALKNCVEAFEIKKVIDIAFKKEELKEDK